MSIRTVITLLLLFVISSVSASADQPPLAEDLTFNNLTAESVPLFIDLLTAASDADGDPLDCRVTQPPGAEQGYLESGPSPCTVIYHLNPVETVGLTDFAFEVFQISNGLASEEATVDLNFYTKSAPGNPTATATSSTTIRLAWFDVQGELGYEIYGGTDSENLPLLESLDPVIGGGPLLWDHGGRQPETTYFYRIDACYSDGCLSSPQLSATTPSPATGSAPFAADDSFEVGEGQQLFIPYEQLLDNDQDPNGDPIAFLDSTPLVSQSSFNELLEVDGGFRFIASHLGNFTQDYTDTFTYRITDGQNHSQLATVSLTVRIAPQAEANPDAVTAERDRALEIVYSQDLFANDVGALAPATLHFTTPAHGRLDFCCQVDRLRYIPEPGFVGTDAFWYSISGGGNSMASAEVTVQVIDPGTVPPTAGVPEEFRLPLIPEAVTADGVTRLPLLFSDLWINDHGRGLTLELPLQGVSSQGGGEIDSVTPGFDPSGGPAPVGYEGLLIYETETTEIPSWATSLLDDFRYTLVGEGPLSSGSPPNLPRLNVRLIRPEITPANPVVAVNDLWVTAEGERLPIAWLDLLANDLFDRSAGGFTPLNILRFAPPVHGHIAKVTSAGGMVYRAPTDFVGIDHFTYAVQIGSDATTLRLGRVIVEVQSGHPVPEDDSATTLQDIPVVIPVLDNDFDPPAGGALEVVAVSPPTLGYAVVAADGRITYVPPPETSGSDSFTYTVEDKVGLQATAVVSVAIGGPNQPPIARDDRGYYNPAGENILRPLVNDIDPDGHTLTIQSFSPPEQGSLVLEGDSLIYSGPPGGLIGGRDLFTYTISDGFGGTATATFFITQI